MSLCPCMELCTFCQNEPETERVKVIKQEYCFGDPEICARYKVRYALGIHNVPDDLKPGEHLRAATLIRQSRN